MKIVIRILWIVVSAGAVAPALAQPAPQAPVGPRHDVYGYAIEGRNLLPGVDFTYVVSPFLGRSRSAADIERARRALQQTYHDLGHCAVKVNLAQAEPRDGVVTFTLADMPSGEIRDCLPMVAANEPSLGPGRDAPGSVQRPAPAGHALRVVAPAGANKTAEAATGATITPYVEGVGKRGLTLAADSLPGSKTTNREAGEQAGPAAKAIPVAAPLVKQSPAEPLTAQTQKATQAISVLAPSDTARETFTPTTPSEKMPAVESTAAPVQIPVAAPAPSVVAQAGPTKPVPPAEAPPADVLKFAIERFAVEGNTLLKQEAIDRAVAPFVGAGKDFGDVQRALEALQLVYQQEGYGGVEIRLPEQELDKGVVLFRVIEPKIGKVLVEGNEYFSTENILRSVPGLRAGETPNAREIGKGIRLANENAAKQSTVVLRASERDDQVDAVIRVADVNPQRWTISLDNTGNQATHDLRLGVGYQHANLFDRDHILTGQYVTAPANIHDVTIYGLGYRIPIYSLGDSVEFVGGYSNVDSGTVGSLFNVSGKGAIYAARYSQLLPKWRDIEHKLIYGLDYRAYQNQVSPVGTVTNLVPDITVHPLSLGYSANVRLANQDLTVYAGVSQNIPGGNDGKDENFKALGARFEVGTASYRLYRYGATYSGELPQGWQFRLRLEGQATDDALVAGEQFGLGGAESVRGFNERYTSNDKGYRTNVELYTPDWAKPLGLENGRLRFLAFYDQGNLRRNKPLPGELHATSLDSGGLGLRLTYKNNFSGRLDVAYVFHDGTQQQGPTGRTGSTKAHFSMAWVW